MKGQFVLTSKMIETGINSISSFIGISGSDYSGCSIHRLTSRDKFGAIREVVNNCPVFDFFDKDTDKEIFLQEIFNRESLGTTGIGHNVAIPHGKSKLLDRVRVGLGISKKGLDFASIDGEPVHLVLVIGSHPLKQMEYLKALAFIMNHLKNPLLRSALINLPFSKNKKEEKSYSQFLDVMQSQVFF